MKQVLLINIARMGDLVQMGSLLRRLQHESRQGAAVDLVVDQRFAPVASLLPHLRHVVTYDFHMLVDDSRARSKDVVTLYREIAAWALPLRRAGYDRIINLTFNRQSAFLASYIGASDMRGVAATPDGHIAIHNPWMAYLTDMHRYRRFNRFNLVDIYAWAGVALGLLRRYRSSACLRGGVGKGLSPSACHTETLGSGSNRSQRSHEGLAARLLWAGSGRPHQTDRCRHCAHRHAPGTRCDPGSGTRLP